MQSRITACYAYNFCKHEISYFITDGNFLVVIYFCSLLEGHSFFHTNHHLYPQIKGS